MDFSQFKKNRSKITESVEKMKAQKPSYTDDRFWELQVDAAFNGEAIIRFLPQLNPEAAITAMFYYHSFKQNGKWFWENCLTSLGQDCPACQYVQPFWDEDTKESKAKARIYSRKKTFVSNILVIKDPSKPDNNGKVFLFKFGVKIYEKLLSQIAPKSELIEPTLVHDLWEGQNFHIICAKVNDYHNYDTSKFLDKLCPVATDDKGIEEIYKQIRSLDEFVDPSKFKTFVEFKKKFDGIMKIKPITTPDQSVINNSDQVFEFDDTTSKPDTNKSTTDASKEIKETVTASEKLPDNTVIESKENSDNAIDSEDFSFEDEDFNFEFEE